MLGPRKRLLVVRLATPRHFPVGRLFSLCTGIVVPTIKQLISGSPDTCACLPTAVTTFPRKRTVRNVLQETKFHRIHFGQFAFKVDAVCLTAGWRRFVSGCNLVNCPLKRSFSGSFFRRGFKGRNVSTRCLGFRVPSVKYFPSVVAKGPKLRKLGIAVPCGRRIVPFLSRLDRRTRRVKTIGIIGISQRSKDAVLGKCGSSIVKFVSSVHPLLGRIRHGTLVLKAKKTSGTMHCKLRRSNVSYAFIDHAIGANVLACRRLARRVVASRLIVMGAAPIKVCPEARTYPSVPCSVVNRGRLLFSIVCGPRRALFLRGKQLQKTSIGGNLRVLVLRTGTT